MGNWHCHCLLCHWKVFLIKYFSSYAVQKEPTQSPIQSHSTSHSTLLNRLSANHHWLPSPGWILWSHCEYLYKAQFVQYEQYTVYSSIKMNVFSLSALRPNRACPYHWDPRLPAWNLPPTNSLLCIKRLPRLLLWRHPGLWWLTNTTASAAVFLYTHVLLILCLFLFKCTDILRGNKLK